MRRAWRRAWNAVLVACWLTVISRALGMMAKNQKTYDPSRLSAQERLRANVMDLFAQNVLSGKRVQELCNDASAAGNATFSGLANDSASAPHNASRNLRRKVLKESALPSVYLAQIRLLHKRTQAPEQQWVALWLPHELVDALCTHALKEKIMCRTGMDASTRFHVEDCEAKAGDALLGFGLWGDGVPCNWDRTESVETLTLNLPSLAGSQRNLRIPLVGLSKKQCCEDTWTDVFEVLQWSFQHCASGKYPTMRHDSSAWRKSDWRRSRKSGQDLECRSCLAEVRGDWDFFARVFGFPRWNTKRGCCWRCKTTPDQALIYFRFT